jgi:hypothetical protein
MRVLVVGEGKHELGTEHSGFNGALVELVRRLLPEAELEARTVRQLNKQLHAPAIRGRHGVYEKRALQWLKQASEENFDALVLVVDEDGHTDRHDGFSRTQASAKWTIARAFGVAVRTFDAWMLADETALAKVLNRTIDRQPDPESLSKPKPHCLELFGGDAGEPSLLYSQIAKCCNLDILTNRCVRGFAPFCERVKSIASPESR